MARSERPMARVGPRRRARAAGRGAAAPQTARELVTALWRDVPPATGQLSQNAPPPPAVLQDRLARLSTQAESLTALGSGAAPPGAELLGQTARSLHAMLDQAASGGARDVLLRVARLERWLALRSQQEPAAECAADLAMWVLEHLESGSRA